MQCGQIQPQAASAVANVTMTWRPQLAGWHAGCNELGWPDCGLAVLACVAMAYGS